MTPLSVFVLAARRYITAVLPRRGLLGVYAGREDVLYFFEPLWHCPYDYVCIVRADGSAQLLSRDEDECRLFAALWELER